MVKHGQVLLISIILLFVMKQGVYCIGGDINMEETKKILNLVEVFSLKDVDLIIVETNKVKFQEKTYIKRMITDKVYIKKILDSLEKSTCLNGLIKAETHYSVIFYKQNIKVLELGVNDWEDGGFIRINYGDIHSDFLPGINFYKIFHKLTE